MICCYLLMATTSFSQKKNDYHRFGNVGVEDFAKKSYDIDTSADAVYLFDNASSHLVGNSSGTFSVVLEVQTRIRLLRKKSIDDLATVEIYMYKWNHDKDVMNDIDAATYNIENGKVVVTKLPKNAFYTIKSGDNQIIKFTFPNLREGSIIEYSYKKTFPNYQYLPSWQFQGMYPKLESVYETEVPDFFEFVTMNQGYLKIAKENVSFSADNYFIVDPDAKINMPTTIISLRSSTTKHNWDYRNVPGLKTEPFISQLANYVQKVSFQFSAIAFEGESPKYFLHTWSQAAEDLLKDKDFGADLSKNNSWINDDLPAGINDIKDPLAKAEKIFFSVRDNNKSTTESGLYLTQSLKKVADAKSGNVADINLLLVAMLRNAGLSANPLILSTRDHGKAFDQYPIMEKFNYVIAELEIGDTMYLLDASDQSLGFNKLDPKCYNGNGRLISAKPSLVDLSPNTLVENTVSSVFLINGENGQLTGTSSTLMGDIESANLRMQMKKETTESYFQKLMKSYSYPVKIENGHIDSLHKPGLPVSVQYDFKFKLGDDIIYYNPILMENAYKTNPFKSAKRFYPVEMPYCMDETYILDMEIPEGYVVDELPKSEKALLNTKDGFYEYIIQQSDGHIQLRSRLKLYKATFEPAAYETLRNFFAFVVEKQNNQIVFKKK